MENKITMNDVLKGYETIKKIIDDKINDYNIWFIQSNNAPSTFKGIKKYYNENSMLLVYNGGDHGLLGQEYNVKFRALHDYMHIKFNLSFSYDDEKKLSDITSTMFSLYAYDSLNCTQWESYVIKMILSAEIKGQIEYYEQNKSYVVDQTKFILNYMGV
jgi:hypothetical protein